jgi:Zn-dependent M28 family amino/carboxypeptidase
VLVASKDFPKREMSLRGSMYLKKSAGSVPAIQISYAVVASIVNQPLNSSNQLMQLPPSVLRPRMTVSVFKRAMMLESSNVVGIIPGTDKKDEYVVLTGHYDHIGRRGDVIYYGADDDGSGTTSVIQMAEAFAYAKANGHGPRRTVVFMTVAGEEEGLLGSEFYSDNPLFPLEKTSVNLNTDMVGRIDPKRKEGDSTNYVYVIGDDKLSSDLAKITDSANSRYSRLELDRRYNDLADPNRFYYRSDHYNFAKRGVPIIFYFNGTHPDYHRPTDTIDKINFDLMAKRVNLIFHTAWIMANRDEMLKRDIPLRLPMTR